MHIRWCDAQTAADLVALRLMSLSISHRNGVFTRSLQHALLFRNATCCWVVDAGETGEFQGHAIASLLCLRSGLGLLCQEQWA